MKDIFDIFPRPWRVVQVRETARVVTDTNSNLVAVVPSDNDAGATAMRVCRAICDAVNAANDEGADAHRPADELDHAVMEHVALEPLRKALASIIKGLTNPGTPDAAVPPETRNHDNTAMLARRVGELEREVATLRAALRSARLIFDGVGDA